MVRDATKDHATPPAIYGHNAGIGVKTHCIWREVIDLFARLDGIDFRQTAPLKPGQPFIRPYGDEWRASEDVLSRPIEGIRPTMIARAGALDQGNLGPNLAEARQRGLAGGVLFLAGSAINSIKNAKGEADPRLGAEAMQQAVEVEASGELRDTLDAVLEAGAQGVMFSETFCGGTVRMVRDATKDRATPPAIYGHNAGIGVKTHCIWREVIDLFARLDGIDFRQTAPLKPGQPFIRPYGDEWRASEDVLSRPIEGIRPTMIARAGALDQGNLGPNLAEARQRGLAGGVLFLAGSAINSIKNAKGEADPRLGAEAMQQAVEVEASGELRDVPLGEHLAAITALAGRRGLTALSEALRQRYPDGPGH
jgi:hypothetical protein